MDDEEQEIIKPPPSPKLFHIFCNNVNTIVGTAILEKIGHPYERNLDDHNIIIGTQDLGSPLPVPAIVKKIVNPRD